MMMVLRNVVAILAIVSCVVRGENDELTSENGSLAVNGSEATPSPTDFQTTESTLSTESPETTDPIPESTPESTLETTPNLTLIALETTSTTEEPTKNPSPSPTFLRIHHGGNGGGIKMSEKEGEITGWSVGGALAALCIGCICFERMYSACKKTYKSRKERGTFQTLGSSPRRPETKKERAQRKMKQVQGKLKETAEMVRSKGPGNRGGKRRMAYAQRKERNERQSQSLTGSPLNDEENGSSMEMEDEEDGDDHPIDETIDSSGDARFKINDSEESAGSLIEESV